MATTPTLDPKTQRFIDPVTKRFAKAKPAPVEKKEAVEEDPELAKRKEEIKKADGQDVRSALFGDKEKSKLEEEPKVDAPPETDDEPPKKEEPKPKEKPAAETKAPVKGKREAKPSAVPITRGDIRAAVREGLEDKEEPVAETPEPEFSSEDQQDLAVLQQMEKDNPRRYQGISEDFKEYTQNLAKYREDWLQKNPGKEFDINADEHSEWYDKNAVKYEDRDFTAAEINLRVEQGIKRALTPMQEQARAEKVYRDAVPTMAKAVDTHLHSFVKAVNPDLAALLLDDKGNVDLSKARIDKLAETDPFASRVLTDLAVAKTDSRGNYIQPENCLTLLLGELEKTKVPNLNYKLDGRDPVHNRILKYISEYEQIMAEAPEDVRMRVDGDRVREFIPLSRYFKLQDEVKNSRISKEKKQAKLDAIDNQYFCVTENDIQATILDEFAARAKKEIEDLNQRGSKKFGKPASSQPPVEDKPKPKAETPPKVKPSDKPTPPAEISGERVVSSGAPGGPPEEKLGQIVGKALFSN